MPERKIRPQILPEVPQREIEFLTKPTLIIQVAKTLLEKKMDFRDPLVSEVILKGKGGHAGYALIFQLPNRCSIEVTRYWWNTKSFVVIGRLERDVMQSSTPILNEEADKPESEEIKSGVVYVLDDLLSRLK